MKKDEGSWTTSDVDEPSTRLFYSRFSAIGDGGVKFLSINRVKKKGNP